MQAFIEIDWFLSALYRNEMKRGKYKCECDIGHLSLLFPCLLFGNMYIGNMLQKGLQLKMLSFENLHSQWIAL